MTPKQKAKILVDEYLNASFNCKDCDMPFCESPCTMLNLSEAKECALICVDEILNAIDWHEYEHPNDIVNYWFEVKKEIQNL